MVQAVHRKSYTELGEHLSRLLGAPRTGSKLTLKQRGKAIGVTPATISMWMSGKRRPERDHLLNLCCVCKASFDDLNKAFELAGYYLTLVEIKQYQSWLRSDLSTPSLLSYNDLTLWLNAIREFKASGSLRFGLMFAEELVRKIKQSMDKEGAKTHLLILYFEALEEATQFYRLVTPVDELKEAERRLFFEMKKVIEDTKDRLLQVRLQVAQGDEKYITGIYRSSYRTLEAANIPSLLALLEPDIQISHVLGSICLDLSDPKLGSTEEFEHATAQLEETLERFTGTIDRMVILHGSERLSRAYARRYQHTKNLDYKNKALQTLEEAEKLAENGIDYPIFKLRVPKARLELIHCGVIEDPSLQVQASLAERVREWAAEIGDLRSFSQMENLLKEVRW